MRRLCSLIGLSLGLAACRIEPTPEQYIDPPIPANANVSATEAEIQARIAAIVDALRDGNTQRLTSALSPHPDGIVLGPDTHQPLPAEQLSSMLQSAADGGRLMTRDVVVAVDSANRVAWFVSRFVPDSTSDSASTGFDFSGVFVRDAGDWRLIQGHVSRQLSVQSLPPPEGRP